MSDEPTIEEIKAIVLAEYAYWRDCENEAAILPAIGAMGAAANIYCAIAAGHRAPWHPQVKAEEVDQSKLPPIESLKGILTKYQKP